MAEINANKVLQYPIRHVKKEVTIAGLGSLSDAAFLGGMRLTGLEMPSAWTAADITLQGSMDGTNFVNLFWGFEVDTAEIVLKADASRGICLNPGDFRSWPYVKVRSGTSGVPIPQGDNRVIGLILEP